MRDEELIEEGVSAPSETPSPYKAYIDYLSRVTPLTPEQQVELLGMARDEEEPAENRRWANARLWLDCCRLVLYVLRSMHKAGKLPFVRLDDMDAIQSANLAAGLALDRWDPARGALSTFLVPAIQGALLTHTDVELRKGLPARSVDPDEYVTPERSMMPLDGTADEEPMTVLESLTYEHHVFDDPETIIAYGQVRRALVEQHGGHGWGDLAADYLIGETNVRELAKKYGVTTPTVYNRMRKMGF